MITLSTQADGRLLGAVAPNNAQKLELISSTCNCLLAIGEAGLKEALAAPADSKPIIAAYITASAYYQILPSFPSGRKITALFDEPDPIKQAALANLLVGPLNAVAFYSDRSLYLKNAVGNIALIKTQKATLLETLSRMDRYSAVIAIPDSTIWDRDSYRLVVRSLYSQHKVLIGFSENLVNAGALASLYYTDDDYLDELKKFIANLTEHTTVGYPTQYKLAVNTRLARSLDIYIPGSREILAHIDRKASK